MGGPARSRLSTVNRTVWIARIIGVVIILGMMLLLMNLHTKLSRMSPVEPPATETEGGE